MNIVGFLLAGAGLLMLSEVAPMPAMVIGGVLIVGYSVTNPQALNNLASLFNNKVGTLSGGVK